MKTIFKASTLFVAISVTLLLVSFTLAGSIYDTAVKDIDGKSLDFKKLPWKKDDVYYRVWK